MKATMNVEQLNKMIGQLARAEKVTKAALGTLSRELLAHCIEHKDASLVNKVMSSETLSAVNLRAARLYFNAFMPFSQSLVDRVEGGKAIKQLHSFKVYSERKAAHMLEKVEAWLSVETNNIWVWSENNVQMEVKPADYANKLTKLVQKAMADEEEGLDSIAIIDAIIAGGVSPVAIAELFAKAAQKAA